MIVFFYLIIIGLVFYFLIGAFLGFIMSVSESNASKIFWDHFFKWAWLMYLDIRPKS